MNDYEVSTSLPVVHKTHKVLKRLSSDLILKSRWFASEKKKIFGKKEEKKKTAASVIKQCYSRSQFSTFILFIFFKFQKKMKSFLQTHVHNKPNKPTMRNCTCDSNIERRQK